MIEKKMEWVHIKIHGNLINIAHTKILSENEKSSNSNLVPNIKTNN